MPFSTGDPREDDTALGLLLADAHHHCRRSLNDALRPLGIETRHIAVLDALRGLGPASQRRLIETLGLDKSSMVRIMDELERRGLATRKPDARDRRAYAVELTEDGRTALLGAQRIASEVGERLFGNIGRADRDRLVTILTGLTGTSDGPPLSGR